MPPAGRSASSTQSPLGLLATLFRHDTAPSVAAGTSVTSTQERSCSTSDSPSLVHPPVELDHRESAFLQIWSQPFVQAAVPTALHLPDPLGRSGHTVRAHRTAHG